MFQAVEPAPADPILGLTEAFQADSRSPKVNLGVGVYKDSQGKTPVLQSVKTAEKQLFESEASKGYLPISGSSDYAKAVQMLLFGKEHPLYGSGRLVTCQTPGGTGALRVVGDYLAQNHPSAGLHLSDPTWANHKGVFSAAGLTLHSYAYFDKQRNRLDIDAMLEALRQVPQGDVVLLHACCHNPTGVDPDENQWRQIAEVLAERQVTPLVDFAYQGFGDGLSEDAAGLRILAEQLPEMFICSSFSKNFSLYNERVGAMTVVAETTEKAEAVFSRVKLAIRRNYSNPPAHGAMVVHTILSDADLTAQWHGELADMRQRINLMRSQFADMLNHRGVRLSAEGNDFIARQRGMFSFSGLTADEVEQMCERYAIYIVGSGRINVAGFTEENLAYVADAIAEVRGGK